jgi:hypothetical protein
MMADSQLIVDDTPRESFEVLQGVFVGVLDMSWRCD